MSSAAIYVRPAACSYHNGVKNHPLVIDNQARLINIGIYSVFHIFDFGFCLLLNFTGNGGPFLGLSYVLVLLHGRGTSQSCRKWPLDMGCWLPCSRAGGMSRLVRPVPGGLGGEEQEMTDGELTADLKSKITGCLARIDFTETSDIFLSECINACSPK